MDLSRLDSDEAFRCEHFPVAEERVFLAHAAIANLPKCVADAMNQFNTDCTLGTLEFGDVLLNQMDTIRESAAKLIHAKPNEIALLGPTSLGLSLVANGLDWEEGDEIICYLDDYPANVYPWTDLEQRHGVKAVLLEPENTGEITPELVAAAITPKTKLVALASCHFLTGYRIDIDAIGKLAHENGALFCLDAIQTAGAFPTTVEHVDFLSADSHKWMLGPLAAGVVYVAEEHFEKLRPTLLGAWNVQSPNFITQREIAYESGGRRYEPGVLNCGPLFGMQSAIDLLLAVGIDQVSSRLLDQKAYLLEGLHQRGFTSVGPTSGKNASGITTVVDQGNPERLMPLYKKMLEKGVVASCRHDRNNVPHLRFSPHFYNTMAEFDRVFETIDSA